MTPSGSSQMQPMDSDLVFGAQNICRVIAARAAANGGIEPGHIGWPEALHEPLPLEHLAFRPTAPLDSHAQLAACVADFGRRKAAWQTAYRFD